MYIRKTSSHVVMIAMEEFAKPVTRQYAEKAFESYFEGKGSSMEEELFSFLQRENPDKGGWDFYQFRREYKEKLFSILQNLKNENSSLLEDLQNGKSLGNLLTMDTRKWANSVWNMPDEEENEDGKEDTEMREGTFSCSNCSRRGVYSRNTSHYELQTRSSDEPLSIFLQCHTCGKKYRFSS